MLVITFREAEYLVNTRYGYLPIRIGTHLFWGWSGVGGQGAVLSKYELMFYESSTPLISYCGVIDGWPLVPPKKAHVTPLQWRKTFMPSVSTSLYKLDLDIYFAGNSVFMHRIWPKYRVTSFRVSSVLCNDVSHWLVASLESVLYTYLAIQKWLMTTKWQCDLCKFNGTMSIFSNV